MLRLHICKIDAFNNQSFIGNTQPYSFDLIVGKQKKEALTDLVALLYLLGFARNMYKHVLESKKIKRKECYLGYYESYISASIAMPK